ncbi:unnamed protein product [Rhizophagus irregularis]|nr:unnamed protein product [Rhizophagus irregularis]
MCSGNLQGITKKELEIWLKSATTISFVHIIKQIHNFYGHIHFNTSLEAGSFFSRYSKDFTMDGLQNIAIRISVSYYFITRRKVDYLEVVEKVLETEEQQKNNLKFEITKNS